jgi:hypothetical protein
MQTDRAQLRGEPLRATLHVGLMRRRRRDARKSKKFEKPGKMQLVHGSDGTGFRVNPSSDSADPAQIFPGAARKKL